MPGRLVARAPRASDVSTKTRSSTSTRGIVAIPDEGQNTSLRALICATFADVQRSANGHRKIIVNLRKVQEACCYEPAKPARSAPEEDFDEIEFNDEICRCLIRILPVKKSEPVGDRIIKFIGAFLRYASTMDNAIFRGDDPDGIQAIPETPSSRLTTQIVSLLIPLLPAKDKVVRFRCTQIISHLINTVDSIDDELFHHIRLGLLKRLRDKESNVRVQAVYGLGRLAGEMGMDEYDDEDSDDESAGGVLERLLDILQNDPSAEVRRSLLLNLPFTPTTLPFLLERARDLDATIRRALYSRLLPALGDFRHLSLTHREKLLRWGLRDRDDNVKKATARLFRERWIEDCVRPQGADTEPEAGDVMSTSLPSFQGLLELLERIDVVNSGVEGGIALDAMREFWQGRPDYCDFLTFEESFWNDLTPESVFVARTFNGFSQSSSSFEDKMPEVTRFAFLIQTHINALVEKVRQSALQPEFGEDSVVQEFIVEQLLHIALTLDYSDEVGRRTMFSLMREALALAELPEEATKLVAEVLRTVCGESAAGEKEFSDVVLEAIAEVHDTIMGEDQAAQADKDMDESFHSARSELSGPSTPPPQVVDEEKAVKEIMVNMKCLHIAQCMLQNVECALERNPALVTMLNNLVVPAVRSQEAPIRERGLLCLGLYCLLDRNLAEENLELFLLCFSKGHEALQSIAIQIIGDILSAHPTMLSPATPQAETYEHPLHKPIHKLFSKSLKSSSALVQSTACTALAKLMLSTPPSTSEGNNSILDHDELLRMLTIAYFDPELASNSGLRQSLSYFLPVYCHSRRENLQRMGRVALAVLNWVLNMKEEMDMGAEEDSITEMVGINVVTAHLVEWTDERKLASVMMAQRGGADDEGTPCEVHLQITGDILEKVLGVCSKEERKIYISMLNKLHVSSAQDTVKVQWVTSLLREAIDEKIAEDAPSRNVLNKLHVSMPKARSEGQSRAVSRARSIAPSTADDDEDDSRTAVGGEESNTTAATVLKDSEMTHPSSDDADNTGDFDASTMQVKGENSEDQDPGRDARQGPSRISRPRWKPEELEAQDLVEQRAVTGSKPSDSHESAEDQGVVIDEEPGPRRRGRPAKAKVAASESLIEQEPPRPARRNVRASRRQQRAAIADDDMELD